MLSFRPSVWFVAATTAQFRLRRRWPILLPLLNLWLHQAETVPGQGGRDARLDYAS
jgi:hypothetical protein